MNREARRQSLRFQPTQMVLLSLLVLFCASWASDENGTFDRSTQMITFTVDQPCSIVIYFDITPRIECFYEETRPIVTRKKPESSNTIINNEIAQEIFNLINLERINHRLAPLQWNDDVSRAALLHSTDMNHRDYFEHESPDGKAPKDRLIAAGAEFTCCGECLYMTTYAGQDLSKQIVDGWMNSPGHRAIILTDYFDQGGVGVWFGKEKRFFTFNAITGDDNDR